MYRPPKRKITVSIICCINVQVLPFDLDILWKNSKWQHRQRTHKTLGILLDAHESPFEALLAKNDETNVHTKNLRVLIIEIHKTLTNTNPQFMQEYFIRKDIKYDLSTRGLMQIPAAKSIKFGIDSIKVRCSLLWNSIPDVITKASSAALFKNNMGNWNGEECNCKILR